MPAVLIHGVPDTHRLWDGVRGHLSRHDVQAWDLPGFGSPRAEGFGSTKEEYVDWLIQRLESIGEPVDLVGHDWGCILTARVASLRPDLVKTWAGGNGPINSAYHWHALAEIWQDPDKGAQFMADSTPASLADLVASFDIPAELASQTAAHVDDLMKDSILKLYRSAVTVGTEWEPGLANVQAPSLVFWGALDPACQIEFGHRLGESLRAVKVVELDCNHWTVLQKPAQIASLLEAHWNTN
ncbi:alpha/beta fold hydrolase [Kribbella sp. NPDC058245]|uniref:alpha/beta fold hydrolase n=1 Tax=Kribbella sp. NPDC058245 TaxID=3346399 RepID=UPI0036ED922E